MLYIKKLNADDGKDVFLMLKTIEVNENEFTNPVNEMTYDEYKEWLKTMDNWSRGEDLKEGYVPQTIYWLYKDDIPIGIGKIRHKLTDSSRKFGGNIGYAISREYRGNGYATTFLSKLIEQAKQIPVEDIILTVEKYNDASKKVIEKNNGILIEENDQRWIFRII